MSLRHNCNPFENPSEVRELFQTIYSITREWMHVASLAGSCALAGIGNDLDIILVPFWNEPAALYPVRIDHDSLMTMLTLIAEKVGGTTPLFNGDLLNQAHYCSGIVMYQVWLPNNRVIDIKVYPAEYVREDIRKTTETHSITRKESQEALAAACADDGLRLFK